jgi:A/G-specific adenine glycosylase
MNPRFFRKHLLAWYQQNRRDLPWRNTTDPYPIWLSEIMLQQTRVAAVIPYYGRFLERFPSIDALAAAPEDDVLNQWAGLGYYSRARNLQKAARQVVDQGGFPTSYAGIRALAGIGDYTAAAIASIAFGLPYAALDGNVMRVVSRLYNDSSDIGSPRTRQRFQVRAQELLDLKDPGMANQAMMELGATVCLPKSPNCAACPVSRACQGFQQGTQRELPVKARKQQILLVEKTILLISRGSQILMWQRPADSQKLKGFWELPEASQLPRAILGKPLGEFRHSITNHDIRTNVVEARIRQIPNSFVYIDRQNLEKLPVTTATKKALACSTP